MATKRRKHSEEFKAKKGGVERDKPRSEEELTAPLYEQIGRLKVDVDWLKNALSPSVEVKLRWIT